MLFRTVHTYLINILEFEQEKGMESNITGWFDLISKVGFPIVSAIVAGYFIFLTLKFILDGTLSSIKNLSTIITKLDNRINVMSHDIIRIDILVSTALGLKPDVERISRSNKSDMRLD